MISIDELAIMLAVALAPPLIIVALIAFLIGSLVAWLAHRLILHRGLDRNEDLGTGFE